MIRTDDEYKNAVARIDAEKQQIADQKKELEQMGLEPAEIKRALDPIVSFRLQLVEEVESYERLKRGQFGELTSLQGLGRLIIAVRIHIGLTQKELADRLGVDPSQVSRDERNEYHGITVDRAARILEELGVTLKTVIELESAA